MRDVSKKTRVQVDWIKRYISRQYTLGKNPPDSILGWKRKWFPNKDCLEIYQLIHLASKEIAEETGGRIQFRHNFIQDIWRFHDGMDDYLMLLYGDHKRISGHIKTQNIDYDYSIDLTPKIKDEIKQVEVGIIDIGIVKSSELKQKYNPS